MSAEEFLVWGGRGHAKVIRDLLALNQKRVVAVIDNDRDLPSPFNDVDIFYGEDGFRAFFDLRDSKVGAELSLGGVVAIGGVKGKERVEIYEFLIREGLDVESLIHQSAIITSSAMIGKGDRLYCVTSWKNCVFFRIFHEFVKVKRVSASNPLSLTVKRKSISESWSGAKFGDSSSSFFADSILASHSAKSKSAQ